jgi:formate dehydrogenase iron-sulfur subunit
MPVSIPCIALTGTSTRIGDEPQHQAGLIAGLSGSERKKTVERRNFLKCLGALGGSSLTLGKALAGESPGSGEPVGVLVDTTRCLGCRTCEMSCAEAHGLPAPDFGNNSIFDTPRTTSEKQWTVVNRYKTKTGDFYVKRQCMHCVEAACAAGCPTRAMYKTQQGPVIWRENKCMGCRYCMLSCPFDIPKFEYDKAVPRIQKCILCWDRLQKGLQPACVENCPGSALLFGKRSDLLVTANERIYAKPTSYHRGIYGEQEVGGTGWLYISAVPFHQLGFRTDLGNVAYPEYTKEFLYGVPVVLLLWPAMLLGLNKAAEKDKEDYPGK